MAVMDYNILYSPLERSPKFQKQISETPSTLGLERSPKFQKQIAGSFSPEITGIFYM